MATILILPQEARPLRKVTCDCSGNGDCDNLLCWQHSANYLAGGDKPNYPVPAIREHIIYAKDGIELYREDYSRDFGEYISFPY